MRPSAVEELIHDYLRGNEGFCDQSPAESIWLRNAMSATTDTLRTAETQRLPPGRQRTMGRLALAIAVGLLLPSLAAAQDDRALLRQAGELREQAYELREQARDLEDQVADRDADRWGRDFQRQPSTRGRLYVGCQPVGLGIYVDRYASVIADQPILLAEAESRLQAAHLYNKGWNSFEDPVLRVDVTTAEVNVFRVRVEFWQALTNPHTGTWHEVGTWSREAFGNYGSLRMLHLAQQRVHDHVRTALDDFIFDYLAANEEACEASQ